jgi:hypothetical protein
LAGSCVSCVHCPIHETVALSNSFTYTTLHENLCSVATEVMRLITNVKFRMVSCGLLNSLIEHLVIKTEGSEET